MMNTLMDELNEMIDRMDDVDVRAMIAHVGIGNKTIGPSKVRNLLKASVEEHLDKAVYSMEQQYNNLPLMEKIKHYQPSFIDGIIIGSMLQIVFLLITISN